MEDEDEVTKSVQEKASMADETPLKEKEQEDECSVQCGIVLTAGGLSEELGAAVVEREEDDAVENIEELKLEGAKLEELAVATDDGVKMEENVEVAMSEVAEVVDGGVRVEEVENLGELKFEGAKMEELAVAPDDGGVRMEEVSMSEGAEVVDDSVKVEGVKMEKEKEGRNVVENVEFLKSKGAEVDVGGGEIVGVGDDDDDDDDDVKMAEEKEEGGVEEDERKRNKGGIGIVQELKADIVEGGEVKTLELETKMEGVIDNGEQGSGEGEVKVDVEEELGVPQQAEKKEQEGGVGAEKGEVMLVEEGGEGAEKGEVMLGEECGEGAEQEEEKRVEEAEEEEEGSKGAEKEEEVEEGGGEEEKGQVEEMDDSEATGDGEVSPRPPVAEEEVSKEEDTPIVDTEMETESEVVKSGSGSGSGGKRRRGRIPKASTPVKVPARKTVGEDVCFICLDGGDLVLCDRRFVCFFLTHSKI